MDAGDRSPQCCSDDASALDLRTAVWRALREVEALKVENEHLRLSLGGVANDTEMPLEAEPASGPCFSQVQDEQEPGQDHIRAASTACAGGRQRFNTVGGCHSPQAGVLPHQRMTNTGVTRHSRLSLTTGGAASPAAPSSARCLSSGCGYSSFAGCPPLSEQPELPVEVAAAEAAAAAAGTSGSLAAFRRSAYRRRSAAAGCSSGGGASFTSRGGSSSRRNSSRRIPLPPFLAGLAGHTAAQRQQVLYEVASPFSSYAAAAAVDESDEDAEAGGASEGAASPEPKYDADTAAAAPAPAAAAAGVARRLTMGSRRWLMGSSAMAGGGGSSSSARAPSGTGPLMHLTPLSRTASGADLLAAAAAPIFAAYSCVDSELVGPEGPATAAATGPAETAAAAAAVATAAAARSGASGYHLEAADEACASPYCSSEAEEEYDEYEEEEEAYGWLYSSDDEEETWSSRTSRAAAGGKVRGGAVDSSSGGDGGRSGWFARWLGAMGAALPPITKAFARMSDPEASSPPRSSCPASESPAAEPVAVPLFADAGAGAIAFVDMLPHNGAQNACGVCDQQQRMLRGPSACRLLGQQQQEAISKYPEAASGCEALEGDSSRSLGRSRFSWRR